MKRMRAISRCEVSGKVYLPGDEIICNQEQFNFLRDNGAAVDHPQKLHSNTPVLRPGATIEEVDTLYRRLVGKDRPKKEKVK